MKETTVKAGDSTAAEGTLLRVGVSEVPPFVMRDAQQGFQGISVDLWAAIAAANGYRFEWVPMPFQQLLPELQAGRLDVVIGALTMTAEREARIDFTHPFYRTGLAIAVPSSADSPWTVVRRLLSWDFVSVLLALGGVLLAVGALVWAIERRHNSQQFGGSPVQGMGHGLWWAAVTMTTVGYGDKAPVTFWGRLVAVVWMFAALIMVSGFTAAVTSALTVGSLRSEITGPQDLHRTVVATVSGTSGESFLRAQRLKVRVYPDLRQALLGTQRGEAGALVYDRPILLYRNSELAPQSLQVLPGTFDEQSYGFAVASGSAWREDINRALLAVTGSAEWAERTQRYLGAQTP
jgi:ABC-type amino acid transport substrate-binding protein